METQELFYENINSFRTSEYKWKRELVSSFEEFFDQNCREILTKALFSEINIKAVFLFSLWSLENMIMPGERFLNMTPNLLRQIEFGGTIRVSLNKEKMEDMYELVTASIRGLQNYEDLRENHNELVNLAQRLIAENKVYKQALEDKQEKDKKQIENMAKSYIETCEKSMNFKPKNDMLSKISGIEERLWRDQKRNEIFLKFLVGELNKKYNLQNKGNDKKREFWWKAINYIDWKITYINDPDGFKRKIHLLRPLNEDIGSESYARSKMEKLEAQEKRMEEQDNVLSELKCFICGASIEWGSVCEDCKVEFPIT